MKSFLNGLIPISYVALTVVSTSCFAPAPGELSELSDDSDRSYEIVVSTVIRNAWSLTRGGEETVPVPIYYYLFNSEGDCVKTQKIEDSTEDALFEVDKGSYSIYALCGYSGNAPSMEDVDVDEPLFLDAKEDICIGHSTIAVNDYGDTKSLQIPVNHAFAKVSLEIGNVPKSVAEISATFGNVYKSVTLNLSYEGSQNVTKSLSKNTDDATVWRLIESFVYPSIDEEMPVSLAIKSTEGDVQTVETTTAYSLHKGLRTSLTANFASLTGVNTGIVIENGWQETSGNINFWGNNQNSSTSNVSSSQESARNVEEGKEFGNTKAIVLSVKDNGDGNLTAILVATQLLQGQSRNDLISQLATYNETSGNNSFTWRLPSSNDWDLLCDMYPNVSDIKNEFSSVSGQNVAIDDQILFILNDVPGTAFRYNKSDAVVVTSENLHCFPFTTYTFSE